MKLLRYELSLSDSDKDLSQKSSKFKPIENVISTRVNSDILEITDEKIATKAKSKQLFVLEDRLKYPKQESQSNKRNVNLNQDDLTINKTRELNSLKKSPYFTSYIQNYNSEGQTCGSSNETIIVTENQYKILKKRLSKTEHVSSSQPLPNRNKFFHTPPKLPSYQQPKKMKLKIRSEKLYNHKIGKTHCIKHQSEINRQKTLEEETNNYSRNSSNDFSNKNHEPYNFTKNLNIPVNPQPINNHIPNFQKESKYIQKKKYMKSSNVELNKLAMIPRAEYLQDVKRLRKKNGVYLSEGEYCFVFKETIPKNRRKVSKVKYFEKTVISTNPKTHESDEVQPEGRSSRNSQQEITDEMETNAGPPVKIRKSGEGIKTKVEKDYSAMSMKSYVSNSIADGEEIPLLKVVFDHENKRVFETRAFPKNGKSNLPGVNAELTRPSELSNDQEMDVVVTSPEPIEDLVGIRRSKRNRRKPLNIYNYRFHDHRPIFQSTEDDDDPCDVNYRENLITSFHKNKVDKTVKTNVEINPSSSSGSKNISKKNSDKNKKTDKVKRKSITPLIESLDENSPDTDQVVVDVTSNNVTNAAMPDPTDRENNLIIQTDDVAQSPISSRHTLENSMQYVERVEANPALVRADVKNFDHVFSLSGMESEPSTPSKERNSVPFLNNNNTSSSNKNKKQLPGAASENNAVVVKNLISTPFSTAMKQALSRLEQSSKDPTSSSSLSTSHPPNQRTNSRSINKGDDKNGKNSLQRNQSVGTNVNSQVEARRLQSTIKCSKGLEEIYPFHIPDGVGNDISEISFAPGIENDHHILTNLIYENPMGPQSDLDSNLNELRSLSTNVLPDSQENNVIINHPDELIRLTRELEINIDVGPNNQIVIPRDQSNMVNILCNTSQGLRPIYLKCIYYDNDSEQLHKIGPSLGPVKPSDDFYIKRIFDLKDLTFGQFILRPFKGKPAVESEMNIWILVKSGTILAVLNSNKIILKENDCFLVPPNNAYSVYNLQQTEATLIYLIF